MLFLVRFDSFAHSHICKPAVQKSMITNNSSNHARVFMCASNSSSPVLHFGQQPPCIGLGHTGKGQGLVQFAGTGSGGISETVMKK